MPVNSDQVFDPSVSHQVLTDLISSFQENCLKNAEPIPNVVEREEVSEFESDETSTGQGLVSAPFSSPPTHIPVAGEKNNARHAFKSELSLVRDPRVGTKKILWWYAADPRKLPHNHPWDFRSAILSGGYTEERFTLNDGIWVREIVEYGPGSVNVVAADVFHNVIDVQPDTVTFLDCGPARKDNQWGYLDVEKEIYFDWKEQSPDNFVEIFKALNAH